MGFEIQSSATPAGAFTADNARPQIAELQLDEQCDWCINSAANNPDHTIGEIRLDIALAANQKVTISYLVGKRKDANTYAFTVNGCV